MISCNYMCKSLAFPEACVVRRSASSHAEGQLAGKTDRTALARDNNQVKERRSMEHRLAAGTRHHIIHITTLCVFFGTETPDKVTVCFKVWRLGTYWLWSLSAYN